ncbi:MAG: electron transport complex subunit RsxE [Spirochaetales bacterium]|nr:electron transport complex subunit RsxE [Spirochaetales bacterium]
MGKIAKSRGVSYFIESLWYNNATFSMVLGICSALAITTNLLNALVMGISVTVVLIISSTVISLLRSIIPERVRIITFMLLISTFVIMVDFILKIYLPPVSKALGPYVGLIITNCILMGRAEAFAIKQPPYYSIMDSLGSGIGYTLSIMVLAAVRELLGAGSLFGVQVLGESWAGWGLLMIPSGAFFVLGFYIMLANMIQKRFINRNVD